MAAGRVHVTREREPADDARPVLGHVDGGVRVPPDRAKIAPLLGHGPPLGRRQKPRALLAADLARELNERLRVARLRGPDDDHGTTAP